ncbi:MAG: hypothetical protein AAB276_05750, partial [Pseudomonadota bacterium]
MLVIINKGLLEIYAMDSTPSVTKIKITREQWPVGQGCFSTCQIKATDKSFNYIYDCGTRSGYRNYLQQCLTEFNEKVKESQRHVF